MPTPTKVAPVLSLPAQLASKVAAFKLPDPLGFGQVMAPVMVEAEYVNGEWTPPRMTAYAPLPLDPACKSLHYGQLIFEGMKAFRLADGRPALFRPEVNGKRFNDSARRMAMPELPVAMFLEAVSSLTYHVRHLVPRGVGESLYLRPLMLATEVGLSLKPAETYKFLVLASPSGAYFPKGKVTSLIERHDCRAAPGGTGAFKVAGNYGASIRADIRASSLNCQQTLWLDAVEKSYVEEFSGMNFFAVIRGELFTPPLSETILGGVTRDSVITLAKDHGIPVAEVPLHIQDLLAAMKSGLCTEIFACGTAAVISPVNALAECDGTLYELPTLPPEKSLSALLRHTLIAIQTGQMMGPGDWVKPVGDDLC